MINAESIVDIIHVIIGCGLILSRAELTGMHEEFEEGGVFNCRISRSYRIHGRGYINNLIARLLINKKSILSLLVLGIFSGVLISFARSGSVLALIALGIAGISSLTLNYVIPFGKDGSDQMLTVAIGGLAVTEIGLYGNNTLLTTAGLWFITLQSILSYFTSGIAKLFGETWRSGDALYDVLSTRIFGAHLADEIFPSYGSAKLSNWAVIIFEVSFPIVLLLGYWSVYVLSVGLMFHISIAYVMGLNTFIFAFCSTYPAIFYCSVNI